MSRSTAGTSAGTPRNQCDHLSKTTDADADLTAPLLDHSYSIMADAPSSSDGIQDVSKVDDEAYTLKAITFLVLLTCQIGIQPALMKWYAKDATNISLRIVVVSLLKIAISLAPLLVHGDWRPELKQWSVRVALRTTALPALIYTVQDYLIQTSIVVLDGVTFNVLNQTKIIWTAVFVYLMLGKKQSTIQVLALVVLVASAVVIAATHGSSSRHDLSTHADDLLRAAGLTRAMLAAVLSALAGTIIQRALQKEARNANVVTIELSVINIFCCFWSYSASEVFLAVEDDSEAAPISMWQGWTVMTFVTLLVQALGGVLVGFVIKYSGNVKKSFAVVGGLLFTAVLESVVNKTEFGLSGYVATILVTLSTVLYTQYPSVATVEAVSPLKKAKDDDVAADSSDVDDISKVKRLLSPV
ncbi:Aste57867_24485 [Aphanomyces stellatus]|uniref:Aste57867_24485 protein n=1 Tax=Aphanomyces stellatus TaxID=120398 RepID=A0A485LQM1_9STRA|nr:hypothetical protein As57867_024408 [Aphanomyces stellatus]VFU01124.1 Aste57867_24485 [Aphanomyces stellatus]